MRPGRAMFHAPRAPLAKLSRAPPCRARVGKFAVGLEQFRGGLAAIQAAEQNRRRRFHDRARRIAQHIGKPHVRGIFAQANRMRQVRVGMVFDDEMRRPAFASEPRIDALKNPFAAGDQAGAPCAIFFTMAFSAREAARRFFQRVVDVGEGVFGAFDRVLQSVFVGIEFRAVLLYFSRISRNSLSFGLHHLQRVANVHLFFLADVDLVGGIVHAARIAIQQVVQNFGAAAFRDVAVELVLKFLQPVFGEGDVKLDALGRVVSVANLVRFGFGQIILLL